MFLCFFTHKNLILLISTFGILQLQQHGQTEKKLDLENFEIRRFYFQNADVPGEICEKKDRVWFLQILFSEENLL